jgi:hypothetical protein
LHTYNGVQLSVLKIKGWGKYILQLWNCRADTNSPSVCVYSKSSNILDILVGVCRNSLYLLEKRFIDSTQRRCSYFFPIFIRKKVT